MMTPVAQALAQPTDIQSRVNFSDGNREAHLRAFYEWLPSDLHDAPGICWANASSRVLGRVLTRGMLPLPSARLLAVSDKPLYINISVGSTTCCAKSAASVGSGTYQT